MKYFHIPTFIISFALGLFFVYVSAPKKQVIFVYPNLENSEKILVQDDNQTCFKMTPREVSCSKNSKNYPIQTFVGNQ